MCQDENALQIAAYYAWLRRGAPLWDDLVDWFAAEHLLKIRHNMVGEEYFQGRLGNIYSLSPIPYLCGRGRLSRDGQTFAVLWELNVSATGSSTLVLSSNTILDINQMVASGRHFLEWHLDGETLEGQQISGDRLIVSNIRFSIGPNPDIPRYICHFHRIDIRPSPGVLPDSILAFVQNLSFVGIEWSRYGSRMVADKFRVAIAHRDVEYQLQANHDRLKELLAVGRIDRAMLSCISVPLLPNEVVEDGTRVLQSLEWLTAFFSQNRTFAPLIQLRTNGHPCGWIVFKCLRTPISREQSSTITRYRPAFVLPLREPMAGTPPYKAVLTFGSSSIFTLSLLSRSTSMSNSPA